LVYIIVSLCSVPVIHFNRCMADCGSDAHEHVKKCSSSMHPGAQIMFTSIFTMHFSSHVQLSSGSYFGKLTEFNEVHGKRRCKSVIAYLQSIPDPILRVAVNSAARIIIFDILIL
jgi:hypothetical protein